MSRNVLKGKSSYITVNVRRKSRGNPRSHNSVRIMENHSCSCATSSPGSSRFPIWRRQEREKTPTLSPGSIGKGEDPGDEVGSCETLWETRGAFHSTKNSGNSGFGSEWNRHFPEFHSEILGVPREVGLKFRKIGITGEFRSIRPFLLAPSFSEPGNRTQHGFQFYLTVT